MTGTSEFPEQQPADDPEARLECVTVTNDDGADVCTMYPPSCDDDRIATHWITARDESFVSLEEMR